MPFPHLINVVRQGPVDRIVLVGDQKMDVEYRKLTNKDTPERLPHWDDSRLEGVQDIGRSSRAGIAVALRLAKRVKGKNLVVIAYDKAERYDE
ncbi:TPA: hypothetical protein HA318_05460 [Candidatus Micrarchaeota archaeon]|nr:hypothetical protein [Candidatus Micrarchaeota archaeon]